MLDRLCTLIPSVTLAAAVADSTEIPYGSYAGGEYFVPAGATITTVTWYVAEKPGGTYMAAYDEDNAAVTQTVAASRAYAMPSSLYGAKVVKGVGNAAQAVAMTLKG